MLGRLATWLRILGFDAASVRDSQRRRMLERSFLERRILLTREAKLARAHAFRLILIPQEYWPDQLAHLWAELKMARVNPGDLFTLCTECNAPLEKLEKDKLDPKRVPTKVWGHQSKYFSCPRCRKIFWPGSHVDSSLLRLKDLGIVKDS